VKIHALVQSPVARVDLRHDLRLWTPRTRQELQSRSLAKC
jgi:hypothetical protein